MAIDTREDSKQGPETEIEVEDRPQDASSRIISVLRVGLQLDVLDSHGYWCEAEVSLRT